MAGVARIGERQRSDSRLVSSLLVAIAPWLLIGSAIAVLLLVLGFLMVPSEQHADLWFEVGKAGVQLFVIVILGGVVGVILRSLDAMREDQRRLDEYRISLGRDLMDAYNTVKSVRRTLRASGFRMPTSGRLSTEQVAEFKEQMAALVEAEAEFTAIESELKLRAVFEDPEAGQAELQTILTYLGNIIRDWEGARKALAPKTDARKIAGLRSLQAFLGGPEEGFGDHVRGPVKAIQSTIRAALLPRDARARDARAR